MSDPGPPAFACLHAPRLGAAAGGARDGSLADPADGPSALLDIAQAFSPRYERHRDAVVSMDVAGLERLMRSRADRAGRPAPESSDPARAWRTIGQELMRAAGEKQVTVQVAVAGTRVAALALAHACPGLTVVPPGQEAAALAPVPLEVLGPVAACVLPDVPARRRARRGGEADAVGVATFKRWALRTFGDLAALPAADVVARLGPSAALWQAIARGEDIRPLVPTEPEERFVQSIELEWPIEGLEPLSFVLTRLLEPLATQLERRDRGAAVLHVLLDLVTRDVHARRLELPAPMRDVRTLRTLALLDIESHPPAGAIDRVTVVIDPTPGRVVQHTLFTRALPTPERLSTLLARLAAVLGADRVGTPHALDSHRPGAFAMTPFATEGHGHLPDGPPSPASSGPVEGARRGEGPHAPVMALRRCRQPVPARVAVDAGRPVRVTSDRRGFAGGAVVAAVGPWRTSGHWWDERSATPAGEGAWDRDEWDVALSDRARYRVFRDRATAAWFIEGIFD